MKKNIFALLFCFLLSAGSYAAGLYNGSYIYITPGQSMTGTLNLRYNTANTEYSAYIGAYVSDENITFYGRDGENKTFACSVNNRNALFDHAKFVAGNFTSGSQLGVTMDSSVSNQCIRVNVFKTSTVLD